MVAIKIEKTSGGYPAIREHVNGGNRSLIVLNTKGKRKRGNSQKLIRINLNDIAIVCFYYNDQYIINIYKILDIDTEQCLMYVDKINNYESGIWDDTLPEYLTAAVNVAKELATIGEGLK